MFALFRSLPIVSQPTAVNVPSASLHSGGQNEDIAVNVGRHTAATVAVVTPSPFQYRQRAEAGQHPLQTLDVSPAGESSVARGEHGGGSSNIFSQDETFEREGKQSSPLPRASQAGAEARVGARARSPPLPPPPLPPSAGGGHLSGVSAPWHGNFDLLALDPAARDYFLAQQLQLSALEQQLRRLQATMHDKQPQEPQQQQRNRWSEDDSFLPVASSGPALGTHAALAAAAAATAAAPTMADAAAAAFTASAADASEQVPAHQAMPLCESRTKAGETTKGQPIVEAEATSLRASMVEVGTNTSFLWGPAAVMVPPAPPPVLLPHGGPRKDCCVGSGPSPPATTAASTAASTATGTVSTATAASAVLLRSAGARASTDSASPRGYTTSASPPLPPATPAGHAVRNTHARAAGVEGWTSSSPPTERRSVQSSPASRSGGISAATSGWTTQRGHAAEPASQPQRRRRRRREGGEGGGRGSEESDGGVAGDSACLGSEGDDEESSLERAPPLVVWLPGEYSGVQLPNDRDRERWCRAPQRAVVSSLVRRDHKDSVVRREQQGLRRGARLSTDSPVAREARETALNVGPSTSDDDDEDREAVSALEEGGGEKKPGVTVVTPNRNLYYQGALRSPSATIRRRDGGDGSSRGGGGITDRGKATGDDFEGDGEVLRRRWRPLVAGYRGSANVVPVTIAELAVVPRIEFDHLTDDEMGFDLDEGEVRVFVCVFIVFSCRYIVSWLFSFFFTKKHFHRSMYFRGVFSPETWMPL